MRPQKTHTCVNWRRSMYEISKSVEPLDLCALRMGKTKKGTKPYISRLYRATSSGMIVTNCGSFGDLTDVINRLKFDVDM